MATLMEMFIAELVRHLNEHERQIIDKAFDEPCSRSVLCRYCVAEAFDYAAMYWVFTKDMERAKRHLLEELEACLQTAR